MGICGSDLRSPTPSSMLSDRTHTTSSFSRTPINPNTLQEVNRRIPADSNNKHFNEKNKGPIRIVTTASLTNKLSIISDDESEENNKSLDIVSDTDITKKEIVNKKDTEKKIHFEEEGNMIENTIEAYDKKIEEEINKNDTELEVTSESDEKTLRHWINFSGKRALVTGAGKGIGRAVAIRLAECGADVIAVSKTQSDLDEVEKSNIRIKTLLLDISQWEETKTAISNLGFIDLLVNNAGVGLISKFGDITEEQIDEAYNVNLKAIVNISQIIVKGMKERESGGSIVNVSSIFSSQATNAGMSIYSSCKSSVDQITRCMAAELGSHNIRVNAVNPGMMQTRMSDCLIDLKDELGMKLIDKTPLKRPGTADEVAFPILFLLSDRASFINGITLTIDGGLSTGCD